MDKLYFENIYQAYRMLHKAYKHNCPKLAELCEGVIECMEYDEYLMQVAL